MTSQRKVLITSIGSGVGYGALHAFRAAARDYRIIGATAEPVAAGNYRCDRLYRLASAHDPDAYLTQLDTLLAAERPRLLVPGHDLELPLLARHRGRLEAAHGCRVLVSSPEVIRICNDKLESARAFPDHFVASAAGPAEIEALAQRCGYPLIVKPRLGYASRGVRVVFDATELAAALAGEDDLIVQDYLPPETWTAGKATLRRRDVRDGDRLRQDDEYSVQVVMGHDGALLGLFTSRNSLWHGIPFTVETLGEPVLEAQVREMAARLAALGLIGPCNFQARKSADGEYRFFEINARFTGITPVRADMDFNECDAVYRHFVEGEAAPPLRCEPGRWARRYLHHDVFSARDIATLERRGQWPAS